VLDRARKLGVGRRLVEACVDFARHAGGRLLMLQSFRRLQVALGMYERMGFVPMPPPPEMLVLARTEVIMGLQLGSSS
jgi:GNAT superfamily N-acetyltransferase